jgi:integrase
MGKRRAKGEGSITYNSSKGKWQGSYRMPDGKRAYVYADSQRECARKLTELRRRVDSRIDVVSARSPLSAFLAHWLQEYRSTWKSATYIHNEVICRLHIVPHIGKVKLDAIDVPIVQRWLRTLRDSDDSTDRPVRALRVLRAALNAAVSWRMIDYNPARLVQTPRHKPRRGVALTPAQTATLLEHVKGHRLEALYHIALTLGLRRGELIALHWADIDLDAATLVVQSGKTDRAERTLPLDIARTAGMPDLVTVLREHWSRQQEERRKLPLTWQEHGRVFPSNIGTPLEGRSLLQHLKRLLHRAGLPDVHFHDLRHTALTRLGERGVPPAVVQAVAGHTTPALALHIYTHTDLGALRAALG